jgi:hypothetical protein
MLGGILDGIATFDASTVNIFDGSLSTLTATALSTANVSGGFVHGLEVWHQATAYVYAGADIFAPSVSDFGVLNIVGGTVGHAGALDSGTLNMSGGTVLDGIGADYSGTLNMTGGTTAVANFRGQGVGNIYGGTISDFLMASENSVVNVFGYDLVKTNTGGGYGAGQIYGFWLDHTPFAIDLYDTETYGHVNLVPEPSTILLLAAGAAFCKVTFNRTANHTPA